MEKREPQDTKCLAVCARVGRGSVWKVLDSMAKEGPLRK